jgi:hypothetical protein
MDIDELFLNVYEESQGRLTAQAYLPDGRLQLEFECDDWNGTDRRRRFELRFEDVKEARVHLGFVDHISMHDDHPLLGRHQGEQSALYFSSAPTCPELVFAQSHVTIHGHFGGWFEPSTFLHGTPEKLLANLRGGYGLLATGPKPALLELRASLKDMLKLQLIDGHTAAGDWVAVVMDDNYVICGGTTVREHDI